MALLGQASGGWTESSSALRLLHVSIRNTVSVLSADSFTQTNPPAVATNISSQIDQSVLGVLSGSVAFTRPDAGSNFVGGPGSNAAQIAIAASGAQLLGYKPLGVFINNANGNPFENTPGTASGKGPYVSGQGTFGNQHFETLWIGNTVTGDPAAGAAVTYFMGVDLIASRNGYLMPREAINGAGAAVSADDVTTAAQSFVRTADNSSTIIGVLKMPADAVQNEIVYDQRI